MYFMYIWDGWRLYIYKAFVGVCHFIVCMGCCRVMDSLTVFGIEFFYILEYLLNIFKVQSTCS